MVVDISSNKKQNVDQNEMNKKETLKSYTDYSGLKGTQAKIEQYKNLLDFIIKDCKDLLVEEIRSDETTDEDFKTESWIEEQLEVQFEDLEYDKQPDVSPCDSEELSTLYGYDHGLIIPDELKSLYEEIGSFSIGGHDDTRMGLHMYSPKSVLYKKGFNTFVYDAHEFNLFKDFIDEDKCDYLDQNYCFIGIYRRNMTEGYILLEKSGRGFFTLELDEVDFFETQGKDVESLCNPETAKFTSLDEALAQGFHEATDGLLHSLGFLKD